jgi:hypothetical protein
MRDKERAEKRDPGRFCIDGLSFISTDPAINEPWRACPCLLYS